MAEQKEGWYVVRYGERLRLREYSCDLWWAIGARGSIPEPDTILAGPLTPERVLTALRVVEAARRVSTYDDLREPRGGCLSCDPVEPSEYNAARAELADALDAHDAAAGGEA